MSTELIGKEVLPNVYISKISLHNSGAKYVGKAKIFIKDQIQDDGMPHWSKSSVVDKIKIMFMSVNSRQYSKDITSGNYNLKDLMKLEAQSGGKVHTQYKNIRNCTALREKDIITYMTTFTFDISAFTENQTVFCCLVIPSSRLFGDEIIDKYLMGIKGPTASEQIIVNGNIKSRTNVFLKQDGHQWKGPVHFHEEKGFMEGAAHSDVSHGLLDRRIINNYKILNFIDFKFKHKKVQHKKIDKPITDLFYSFKTKGNISCLFGINYRDIIINHTKYGYNLLNAEDSVFEHMIRTMKINKLSIMKHKIRKASKKAQKKTNAKQKKVFQSEELIKSHSVNGVLREAGIINKNYNRKFFMDNVIDGGDLTDSDDSKIYTKDLSTYNVMCFLREYNLNIEPYIKFYQFDDNTINYTHFGDFKYDIRLEFKDPTVSYVENKVEEMKQGLIGIKKYLSRFLVKGSYNHRQEKATDYFVETESSRYANNLANAPWESASKKYVSYLSLLYDITPEEKTFLFNSTYAKLHPRSATLASVRHFVRQYSNIMKNFYNFFNISSNIINSTPTDQRTRLKVDPYINLITMKYEFKKYISSNHSDRFYNFFNDEKAFQPNAFWRASDNSSNKIHDISGIRQIPVDSFVGRKSDQLEKYGDGIKYPYGVLNPNSLQRRSKPAIKLDKKMSNTIKEKDIRDLNMFFKDVLMEFWDDLTVERIAPENVPPSQYEWYFQDGYWNTTNFLNESNYIASSDILGVKSNFILSEENKDLCRINISHNRTVIQGDSAVRVRLPEFVPMPPLPGSQSYEQQQEGKEVQKSVVIGSTDQIVVAIVNFYLASTVKVLEGFEKDKNGNYDLRRPIWEELTEERLQEIDGSVFCKIWYSTDTTSVKHSKYEKYFLPIADKYFFITSNSSLTQGQPELIPIEDSAPLRVQNLSYDLDFATTNIISQNIIIDKEGAIAETGMDLNEGEYIPYFSGVNIIGSLDSDRVVSNNVVNELLTGGSIDVEGGTPTSSNIEEPTSGGGMGGGGMSGGGMGGGYSGGGSGGTY